MTVFVALNGPPGSGKSTIAWELVRMFSEKYRTVGESFAAPMKHFIAVALAEQYAKLPKDSPMGILAGYTPREFLIDLSEHYIKPRYGQDCWGRWLYHRVLRASPAPDVVIVDDVGFDAELDAIPNHVLVRVMRAGRDFSNDNRSYLSDPAYTINNNSTTDELWIQCRKVVHNIMEGGQV